MRRERTVEDRRAVFVAKAGEVTDQAHFDAIMDSFPEEMRDEIYDEVEPLLKKPFVYVRTGLKQDPVIEEPVEPGSLPPPVVSAASIAADLLPDGEIEKDPAGKRDEDGSRRGAS